MSKKPSPIAAGLVELNALRTFVGLAPLKSWKESAKKLEQKIASTRKLADEKAAKTPQPKITQCPPSAYLQHLAKRREQIEKVVEKRLAAENESAPLPRITTPKSQPVSIPIRLAEIAREIGMDPRNARAKMRKTRLPDHIYAGKHLYHRQFKKDVIAHLRNE